MSHENVSKFCWWKLEQCLIFLICRYRVDCNVFHLILMCDNACNMYVTGHQRFFTIFMLIHRIILKPIYPLQVFVQISVLEETLALLSRDLLREKLQLMLDPLYLKVKQLSAELVKSNITNAQLKGRLTECQTFITDISNQLSVRLVTVYSNSRI